MEGEERRRTDLVQDEDELFPATVERSEFALDGATPGSDGVARVEHLDDDVAHLEHLAERLGVQFQARVLDLALALLQLVVFVVVQHGVLAGLGIGGEGGSEGGGGSESGALLVGRLGCFSPLQFLLLDLRTLAHIARDKCLSKILRRGEAEGTHASLFGLSFCEELVLEREAVGDAEFLGLVCARGWMHEGQVCNSLVCDFKALDW